jgi:hypothetical protein
MFITKLVQIVMMLWLAVRLRPVKEPGLTPAERHIWALVPGYFGAYLGLFLLTFLLPEPLPLAPILALLSGMGFVTLGATVWGWFYVWGAAFFALALVISVCMPIGLLLLGLGWFVCLTMGSYHLYRTR